MNVKIISAILILAIASLACGFSINLPEGREVGPEVEETISVAVPKSEQTKLTISFGAGKLSLAPGARNLIEGTARYNLDELKPEIIEGSNTFEIKQGDFDGLPPFNDIINEWDLQLGETPMDLTVQAGAYEGNLELGGLALERLTVRDGAANVDLSFTQPNPVEMSMLRYQTGASQVKMTGLANANFSSLAFSGGAGNYILDFGGDLQRDATVTVETGIGNLTLIIPEEVDAVVTVEGAVVNVSPDSGWSMNGQTYTQRGSGSTLTILVKMAAGNLLITD
jgi:hypothetical protein